MANRMTKDAIVESLTAGTANEFRWAYRGDDASSGFLFSSTMNSGEALTSATLALEHLPQHELHGRNAGGEWFKLS